MLCVCRDISPTSEMRVEIQRTTGSLFLPKKQQANDVIDLQELFDEYWSSDKREFTVLG